MKKNLISKLYKKIIKNIFFLVYGKVINSKYDPNKVTIKNINKIDNIDVKKFNYKIFSIKNGRVFTNYVESLAVINEKSLIKDVSLQQIKGKLYKSKNQVIETGTPKFLKNISGKMLVLSQGASGHFNYAHWLFDIIPKIKIISVKYNISNIDFFYFSKLTKFQRETFKLLNINPKKIIDSNKFRHVQASLVYAVTHPNYFRDTTFEAHGNIPTWIIIYLRKLFLKKIKKKFNYDNIYIDRSDSTQKHCKPVNNESVISFLKSKNFKILKLSNFSIIDQVSIFNNCKKIVAPHGAGLANITFCKKNTKIIEFFPKNHSSRTHRRISSINKLNYNSVYCKNITDDTKGDMFINLNNFKKYI
jgi:capsular polysaccharide biosynthesis protein